MELEVARISTGKRGAPSLVSIRIGEQADALPLDEARAIADAIYEGVSGPDDLNSQRVFAVAFEDGTLPLTRDTAIRLMNAIYEAIA